MIDAGKMTADVFDKAFNDTPKAFYLQAEKDLDACLDFVAKLDALCDEKLENDSPGFGKIKRRSTEVRHVVHQLLEKKREKEPDPVEAEPVLEEAPLERRRSRRGGEGAPAAVGSMGMPLIGEPADRRQAVAGIVAAARLPAQEGTAQPRAVSAVARLRWGELRSAASLADSPLLEAPPTELRQQIKRLAHRQAMGRTARVRRAGDVPSRQPRMARSAAPLERGMPRWAKNTTRSPLPSSRNCARC